MDPSTRIGIIGAGSSGAYLASLLIQEGFSVDLFEKTPSPRTEGCGILVVQAGMKALHKGNPALCQAMIQAGDPVQRFEFRNLRGGVISSETVTYEPDELPGMLIHRKAILELLLEAIPATCLHGGADLNTVTQTEEGVIAHFKDGHHWQGDILVGADGILSKVRSFVVPGVTLNYLGDLVWRGVVPDPSFCPEGHFIVYARGRGIYANFFQIGGGRTHWGFFMETDLERTGNRTGAYGSHDSPLQPSDTTIPEQALAKLPHDARAVIQSTPADQIVGRYSYDIDPLPHLRQGRIVLMGDAAHAKSSTRARGMTSGWEDALSLCQHFVTAPDWPTALTLYQEERLPIVHEYQRTSRQMSQRIGRR